jgi:Ferritin-like domain
MNRRSNRSPDVLGISEGELRRLTTDLDDLHHDVSLPALAASVDEWVEESKEGQGPVREVGTDGPGSRMISRRGLLLGTGAAAIGGVLLAACGGSGTPSSATSAPYPATLTGDLKVAALAASLENLGIYAYGAGIKEARAGKLGAVPPAIVTFATTAMAQHTDHAAAWNAALTGAGKSAISEPDPVLTPTVNTMFGQVTDVAGLARLALEIENIAAQTYQASIGELSGKKAIATSASIQPVEMQHAAILNLVLGNYPVPHAFNPTSSARPTSDLGR